VRQSTGLVATMWEPQQSFNNRDCAFYVVRARDSDTLHMFSVESDPILYKEASLKKQQQRNTRVGAGSKTSTVTLRVVEGDEKGSLISETVKYGHESQGTRTRVSLRWQGPAACGLDTKTDSLTDWPSVAM
jgi:hypothetical protein